MSGTLALSLGLLGVATLLHGVRRRAPGWALLLVGCAPTLVLLREGFRLYSFHGFMHASIVYQVLTVGIPPTDPLVGGQPLRYPWAHDALLALGVRAFDITPDIAFAVFNVASLLATFLLLYGVAGTLSRCHSARVLGAALAVFGVSPLAGEPIATWIAQPAITPEEAIYPLAKFLHANNNQAGLLGFACFLLLLVKLLAARGSGRLLEVLGLAGVVWATALLYPLAWAPAVGSGGASTVAILAMRGKRAWPAALRVAGALGLGSILALPYLVPLQQGRGDPALALALHPVHLRNTLLASLLALGPIGLLLCLFRDRWMPALREHRDAWICVGVAALVPTGMFMLLHASNHVEHKMLSLTTLAVGLLTGVPLAPLLERRAWAVGLVLFAATLPAFHHVASLATMAVHDPDRYVASGSALEPVAPAERAVALWIRERTPPRAVVLDTSLQTPLCAQRALYAPMLPKAGRPDAQLAGWRMEPHKIAILSFGHPKERIAERSEHLIRVLSPRKPRPTDALLEEIRERSATAALYAVSRGPRARRRLVADPRFALVFEAPPLAVYRF